MSAYSTKSMAAVFAAPKAFRASLLASVSVATLMLVSTSATAQSYSAGSAQGWASSNAAGNQVSEVYNGQLIGSDTSGNLTTLQSTGLTVVDGANTKLQSALTSAALSLTDGTNTTTVSATSITTGTVFATNYNVANFNASNVSASGNGSFGGSLAVTGNQSVGGTLTVSGAAALNGGASVSNGLGVSGGLTADTLSVSSTAAFQNGASVTGGNLNVTNATNTGALAVANNASVGGTLGVSGTSAFTGLATFNGGTQTNGNAAVSGSVAVGGNQTIGGTLNVAGLATFNGGVTFVAPNGSVTTLGTGQFTQMGANGDIISLNTAGDPVMTVSNGTARGTTTINNGDVGVGNNLSVSGNTQLNGNLAVAGPATGAQAATVDFGGNRLQDVGTPILGTDAANKAYVDQGLLAANKRIDKVSEGVAIATSLATPDRTGSQTWALAANWGDFEGYSGFSASAIAAVGYDVFSAGDMVSFGGGIGFGTNSGQVSGRLSVQIAGGGGYVPLK